MSTLPLKHSSLHAAAARLGARFVGQDGWLVPDSFGPDAPFLDETHRVAIADDTPRGRILVEGESAGDVLGETLELSPLAVGAGAAIQSASAGSGLWVYRLRLDQYFISTPPGVESRLLPELEAAAQGSTDLVVFQDLTHAWGEIRLAGPAVRDLLGCLCPLDLGETQFPNYTARQGEVAKTRQVIIRRDADSQPAFSLLGARSLCDYIWGLLIEAGQEFGIVPAPRGRL